jgi:hypothetical protein
MKSRALYFPYISIPESRWLTQMLLYWDQVSSIVPYEYVHQPEVLGSYMQELMREELVNQVIPGQYVHRIPRFVDRFATYLEGSNEILDDRRQNFSEGKVFKIHIEKMGDLDHVLTKMGLANATEYPWYNVEHDTAHDFMTYLATILGQIKSVDSFAVTDSNVYLERLKISGVQIDKIDQQVASLRINILNRILPVPDHQVSPSEISIFKKKHNNDLLSFRRRVEKEIINVLNISDSTLRNRQLDLFYEEADHQIIEIQKTMQSFGWKTIRAGISVLSAIPGIPPLFGLMGAISDLIPSINPRVKNVDFAYAAHAASELAA